MQTDAAGRPTTTDIVLVGGGHAHVHVLKAFGMRPEDGVRVTLIARDVETPYSGMLPGLIAGHYRFEECHIDLEPLARFANARLIRAAATDIDRALRRVLVEDRPPLAYDLLSIDVGATPALDAIPGAAEHALPVKPIGRFLARFEALGSPKVLSEDDRIALAEHLGIDEDERRHQARPRPQTRPSRRARGVAPAIDGGPLEGFSKIAEVDVRASAGPRVLLDGFEGPRTSGTSRMR